MSIASPAQQDLPLRVVHVFRAMLGGLFRHVADLAAEQARAGYAVGIVCDSSTGGELESNALSLIRDQLALGVTRLPMHRAVNPSDFLAALHLLKPLGAMRPDIVHGHGAKGGVYGRLIGTWLGRDRPVGRIYTPHGGSMHYDPASLQGRVYFGAERMLARLTDAIIHVSAFEAATYRAKVMVPICPAVVIPNGLRPEEFDPVTQGDHPKDLLFLGEYRDLKGVDVLLDSVARLATEHPSLSVALVGPGDPAAYEQRARDLGIADRVSFNGPLPARSAFAQARAIVVPSRAESMPYVVLEAVAAGIPIIATNVGGIPEILPPQALVPPDDVTALAEAIDTLIRDPRRAAFEADQRRQRLRERFTVDLMQRQIAKVYATALAAKIRPRV